MDHKKKFLELCGITQSRESTEPSSFKELMGTGRYYLDACDKVASKGELEEQRVFNEMSMVLAEGLQAPARERFGVADTNEIRQLLDEGWTASDKDGWERQKLLVRTAASEIGLNQEQEGVFLELMGALPDILADLIAWHAARLKLIPVENLSEITRVLAEMFEEEEKHADTLTDNRQP